MTKFKKGDRFDFGKRSLSESEIIGFATDFDPLEFHLDKAAAEKSIFGSLVASGPQMFMVVHRDNWIPRFKDTVLAGVGISQWKFLKPIFPNQQIHARVTVLDLVARPKRKHAAVTWLYEFSDKDGELVQRLEMTILHKL